MRRMYRCIEMVGLTAALCVLEMKLTGKHNSEICKWALTETRGGEAD